VEKEFTDEEGVLRKDQWLCPSAPCRESYLFLKKTSNGDLVRILSVSSCSGYEDVDVEAIAVSTFIAHTTVVPCMSNTVR
jgi:hypothetical protein